MERYYLAYGSNLHPAGMHARCPGARPLGAGVLEGWRLAFRGRGEGNYLNIEPDPSQRVPVAVWAVTEEDERALDEYEDYPRFYRKDTVEVECTGLSDGQARRLQAFVYIMHEGYPAGEPDPAYLDACLEGYRAFGFDPGPLYEALGEAHR